MLVPLYGFLRGDTLGLIVLVHAEEPVAKIAACLQQAAEPRVTPTRQATVYFRGKRLDAKQSVSNAGLGPLDRVDVVPEGE